MFYTKKKSGFTLLEMIIVVAIFSLVVLIISSILNSVFLSRKIVVAREKLQSESNSIIEVISKNIRTSQPDYWYYENIGHQDLTNAVDYLSLIDKDNNMVAFKKSENEGYCQRTPDVCLVMGVGSSPNWTNIIPQGVDLVDIKFYIEPSSDPFALDLTNRPDRQPLVTVILKTEANVGSNQSKISAVIQTSISSRIYQQREF